MSGKKKAAKAIAALAKKDRNKGPSFMAPPAHGMKVITNHDKMKQYGHMQGNNVLPGYHPKRNETLVLLKQDKIYLYGVSKLSLLWSQKHRGCTGARYFKYEKIPPLEYWNPDVQFELTKMRVGAPKLTLEMNDGTTKEIAVNGRRVEDIMAALREKINFVEPFKNPTHAEAFVNHWMSRENDLALAALEPIKITVDGEVQGAVEGVDGKVEGVDGKVDGKVKGEVDGGAKVKAKASKQKSV